MSESFNCKRTITELTEQKKFMLSTKINVQQLLMVSLPFLEKVIALVIHDYKRGKILHLDFPHRLHAQLRILQYLHLVHK